MQNSMPARPPAFETMEPGLRRLIANNPSAMTYWGTNTYILGTGKVCVIDPGPDDSSHMRAILSALEPGETVSHIIVTHSHVDHSPLAAPLSRATGAPVLAFGDSRAGRSAIMAQLAQAGLAGGGEGIDHAFCPDRLLHDREEIHGANWSLTALWTPGHMGNHLCLAWNGAVFSGDHVMGWASSLVSPPDGDLTDFMASCRRLQKIGARRLYPGHGAPVDAPQERLSWLVNHRLERERSICDALSAGLVHVNEITARIYQDTPPALQAAAARNVFAHLVDLIQQGRVDYSLPLRPEAEFRLSPAHENSSPT